MAGLRSWVDLQAAVFKPTSTERRYFDYEEMRMKSRILVDALAARATLSSPKKRTLRRGAQSREA